jgi:hypothetical protein
VAAVLAHALIGRLGREPDVTTERNQDRRPSREPSLIFLKEIIVASSGANLVG